MSDQTSQIPFSKIIYDLGKLSICTLTGYEFIPFNDILYLESNSSYTNFYLEGDLKIVSSKTMKYYEDDLDGKPFFRVHRSNIVNLKKVIAYVKGEDAYVILTNKKTIRVTRDKAEREALLSILAPRRRH